jgi:transposase-like protein
MANVAADPTVRPSFAPIPWHDQHPTKSDIEQRLGPDHLAVRIDNTVARLDLTALRAAYGPTGSDPFPPERLLAVVLFETHRGVMHPIFWARRRAGSKLLPEGGVTMGKPRKFTPEFKAKVALAALKADKPLAALCREHQLSDTVVTRWRQQLVERAADLFAGQTPAERDLLKIADLERVIGQLTVELAAAKKLSTLLG